MDDKVILEARERVYIGEGTTDCSVLLCTKRGVIPLDIDRTIVIIQFEDPPPPLSMLYQHDYQHPT